MAHVTRIAALVTLPLASLASLTALVGLSLAGCSASSGSDDLKSTGAAEGSDGGSGGQVTLTEVATDYGTTAPLAGVTTCVQKVQVTGNQIANLDPAPTCATSDAQGTSQFPIDDASAYRVTFAIAGHVSANQLLQMNGDLTTGTRLIETDIAGDLAQVLGTSLDLTKAQPIVTSYTPTETALAGVAVSLSPSSGLLYYVGTNGLPSKTLTATAAAGIAGFLNTPPGVYEVDGTPPAGMSCDISPYVAGSAPNSVLVEAIAGSAGEAVFHCQ